jgi:hypothetical protein
MATVLLESASSKAGMDAKTARKYRQLGRLPSELPLAVRGRTRPDPFVNVWDEVQKLLREKVQIANGRQSNVVVIP